MHHSPWTISREIEELLHSILAPGSHSGMATTCTGDCWWWTVAALVNVVQQQVVPMLLYCSSPYGCGVHITLHSLLCVVCT
jgi:hypothetical protein